MKKSVLLFLLSILLLPCMAETIEERATLKHEVRVGWGDMLFEKAMFHPSASGVNANTDNYRYTGHIFAEYQYRYNDWFSFGGQIDYDQAFWRVRSDASSAPDHTYVNLAIMPSCRFTYFHRPWVNLYSAFYTGLNINTGTELNYRNQNTGYGLAIGGSILGVCVGRDHWYGTAEWGCLCAFANLNEVYKMFARSLFVSVGYRF